MNVFLQVYSDLFDYVSNKIDLHEIPYYKAMIIIGFPFTFCLLFCIFWTCYKFYSKQKIFMIWENALSTISLTLFFFQSTVIKTIVDSLDCTMIEGEYYLTNYLLEKCENNEIYQKWRNLLIIPRFFFFCIILMFVPLVFMFKNKNHLYTDKILTKVGFLLNGYGPQFYYWYYINYKKKLSFKFREFVLVFKKTLTIIIISYVIRGYNACCIIILHFVFFGIENKLNPFGISQINNLNYIANLLTLITIFQALVLKMNYFVSNDDYSLFIIIVIISLNMYFMIKFLKFFIQIRLSFGDKISKFFSCFNKFYKPSGYFFFTLDNLLIF